MTIPKSYISLDKQEIEDTLESLAKSYIETHNNPEKGYGILEALHWIKTLDIYTRDWTKE